MVFSRSIASGKIITCCIIATLTVVSFSVLSSNAALLLCLYRLCSHKLSSILSLALLAVHSTVPLHWLCHHTPSALAMPSHSLCTGCALYSPSALAVPSHSLCTGHAITLPLHWLCCYNPSALAVPSHSLCTGCAVTLPLH